ncbi:MAG: T9SS C-terminal target domain-containing protein, partial [Calditrichaeota bacterium]
KGIDSRDEERCIESKTDWNLKETYQFKVVWDTERAYCFFNGQQVSVLPFAGQVEPFLYCFLGTDNVYQAQPGPIYSNLRLYGPDSNFHETVIFSDVTIAYKVPGYTENGYGHSISWADVDKDGRYDLFAGNAVRDQKTADLLYMNKGSTFYEEAKSRGVADWGLTHSIVSADIDNDGDLDAFYSNMPVYEDKHDGLGRNMLYRNDGKGFYSDITTWAGLSDELNESRGALAADFNQDGWLDLYAVNWGLPNEMYLNRGDGRMIRVHQGADGPSDDRSEKTGVTAADFDNDGDIDLYVCRREANDWLFVNDGQGYFSEKAASLGVTVGGRSHGAVFADIDNDADLDLFVVKYGMTTGDLPLMNVFINDGHGAFIDKTTQYNLPISGYGLAFGDVDNDADLDLLLVYNNDKDPGATPRIFLNDGMGNFEKILCHIEVQAKDARGTAYADIDADGDIDFYVACKDGRNYLFRNDSKLSAHYIDVLCRGPKGDRGGFGSKVTVYMPGFIGDPQHILGYQESVSNFGYLSQNQTALHFGLGGHNSCDVRIVRTDGLVFNYIGVPANQQLIMGSEPPMNGTLTFVSGADQKGTPNIPLALPFVVRLVDDKGVGIKNMQVMFTPQNGGQMIESQPVLTDADGFARSTFRPGANEGEYLIGATSYLTGQQRIEFRAIIVAPEVYKLVKISGDEQQAQPGRPLSLPLVVRVVNQNNVGSSTALVTFEPQNGGRLLESQPILCDHEGYARANYILGAVEGKYVVTARSSQTDTTRIRFSAYAITPHYSLRIVSGNFQSGPAGAALVDSCVVQATDDLGQPASDLQVTFSIAEGSGSINGESLSVISTDAGGRAAVQWTLGPRVGTQKLMVKHQDDTEEFVATAFPSTPALLSDVTAAPQTPYIAGKTYPFACRLEDQFGNFVPDRVIVFKILSGRGDLAQAQEQMALTDEFGIAQVNWTLGRNHLQSNALHASLQDADDDALKIVFQIEAAAPSIERSVIRAESPAIADGVMSIPITVTLLNDEGKGLPDYPLQIHVSGSDNNLVQLDMQSNDEGIVRASLSSGRAEKKVITAYSPTLGAVPDSAVVFFVEPTAPQLRLQTISGDGQTGVVNTPLGESFKVKILDELDHPQSNVQLYFEVIHGGGSFSGQSSLTLSSDPDGVALALLTLGKHAGHNSDSVRVSLPAFRTAPNYFVAHALAGAPAKLMRMLPDSLIAAAGDSIPLFVKVNDAFDNATPNIPVRFKADEGAVMLEEQPVVTDNNGLAHSTVILGPNAGVFTITAAVESLPLLSFHVLVLDRREYLVPLPADTVILDQENDVELAVLCVDKSGAPIENVSVLFSKLSGEGMFVRPTTVTSNLEGYASTMWRPTRSQELTILEAKTENDQVRFYIRFQIPSSVREANPYPSSFALGENFPNPFNPSTTIPFTLAEAGHVSLVVIDVNGRVVRTLVNGDLNAGEHHVVFEAAEQESSLPSGIYFYKLDTEKFRAVKRLLLIK